MLSSILPFIWKYFHVFLPLLTLAYFISNKYRYGINRFPGPWIAAYTDFWRYFENLQHDSHNTYQKLHAKYGDIVRVGPNILSFADPAALKQIYGHNKGFAKSEFYPVQQGQTKGRRLPSLFSTTDEVWHARYRRCVNSAFSMSNLVSYEPLVESTIATFLEQTEKMYAASGEICDFPRWIQFFAFDVIGQLTWSQRIGFIEKNEDVGGIIKFVSDFLVYAGAVGQLPVLDLLFKKNVLRMFLERHGLPTKLFAATKFALERAASREKEMTLIKTHGLAALRNQESQTPAVRGVDLLSKFTQAQYEHPDIMTDDMVLTTALSMVFAGSETTAISLSAVFYYLLKDERAHAKLLAELRDATQDGRISRNDSGFVTWAEAQRLPYLDACVQEAFRMHPAAGLLLERVVPATGASIMGEAIPGGTIVGIHPWVLHRRVEVFGADADVYRPERWLEAGTEQLREMKACMFQFGAGSRTCIGKNISLLEIYKLVPSLLRRFEVELAEPAREWTTACAWFVRVTELRVRFRRREKVL